MPRTYIQLAAILLHDAAKYFRSVGAQNESLRDTMTLNASLYDNAADLLERDPHGITDALDDVLNQK